MTDVILVLNAGSSSIKFALFPAEGGGPALLRGHVDRIGDRSGAAPELHMGPGPARPVPEADAGGHAQLLAWLVRLLTEEAREMRIVAGGHRVVHGGRDFAGPVVATPAALERLAALAPLAPAHQPHNLAGIATLAATLPDIPQIACFDTAFHRTQPRLAQLFALPRQLAEDGVLRYGFHGLSYEHAAATLPERLGDRAEGRIVVAHLGHGASMCGMKERRSVATSMGFTALDGLVMGKRCGELDPGVVLHLLRDRKMSVEEVEDLLTRRSGLLGVSGISDDMRDLLASDAPGAREAVDLFVYRACRRIGSLAAVLGGLDALVFTGGIGERSAEIRARIVAGCAWLGMALDPAANAAHAPRISAPDGRAEALIIPANEERVIARHAARLLAGLTSRAAAGSRPA